LSNFIKKYFYNTIKKLQHTEACLLCKAFVSKHGFCTACWQALMPSISPRCPQCALWVETEGLCGRCLHSPYAFEAVYAAHPYAYPLSHLIHAFKYQKRLSFAKPLAQLMLTNIPPKTHILIPMPLHLNRLRARGFNQAQLLATYLSAATQIPILNSSVTRIRDTPQQSLLDEQSRQHNLRQAFYVKPKQIEGLSITLIDDVITSGASLDALAKSLKKAGAASVICWVLARTQPHQVE
jgi:ComF family protein